MATTKDLTKYYNTLKQSFDKIQDRANKTALINAAFRPKIGEECLKCTDLFDSYINYIKLFCFVYEENFSKLCNNVLVPFFSAGQILGEDISKLHVTLQSISKSNTLLATDLANSIEKLLMDDKDAKSETYQAKHLNKFFIQNVLKTCEYIGDDASVSILQAMLKAFSFHERLNSKESTPEPISEYYKMLYDYIDKLKQSNSLAFDKICTSLIEAFCRDERIDFYVHGPNYVMFYVASLDEKYYEFIIQNLWEKFIDPDYSIKHRRSCIIFIGSFISRADFIDIDRVMNFLSTASEWYTDILNQYDEMDCDRNFSQDKDIVNALAECIFYIISQRYREFYFNEVIKQLLELNLDEFINSPFDPLANCDSVTSKRFKEIAIIIGIVDEALYDKFTRKELKPIPEDWRKPFPENFKEGDMPDQVKIAMRIYIGHKMFTINR